MNHDEHDLTKIIIVEKDKLKLKYKQKLNQIKENYGVEFNLEYFKDGSIGNIMFHNLKYKNDFPNISIAYNNSTNKMSYMTYCYSDMKLAKNLSPKKIFSVLDKKYKFQTILSEIVQLNGQYIHELTEMENSLKNREQKLALNKEFQLDKKEQDD